MHTLNVQREPFHARTTQQSKCANFVASEAHGSTILAVARERAFLNNDVLNRGGFHVDHANSHPFQGNCVDQPRCLQLYEQRPTPRLYARDLNDVSLDAAKGDAIGGTDIAHLEFPQRLSVDFYIAAVTGTFEIFKSRTVYFELGEAHCHIADYKLLQLCLPNSITSQPTIEISICLICGQSAKKLCSISGSIEGHSYT